MRRFAVIAVGACLGAILPSPARAAGDCPDGDWFCEPAPSPESSPSDGPSPEPGAAPDATPEEPLPRAQPPERRIRIDVERVKPAVPRRPRRFREWGVNMHATLGILGGDDASPDAGMNGVGAAVRFRPIPHIALEGSLELVWGTDYNGYDRFEDALMLSGLFFVNPRSSVQLYGLAGFGFGAAYLDSTSGSADNRPLRDETYAYVGLQAGLGLEARITRHFALGGDLIGFVRERNDRNAEENPEFVDPVTHRTSNSSGGGLVRLGATFYW